VGRGTVYIGDSWAETLVAIEMGGPRYCVH
jgi:hypothetical protein